MIVLYLITCKTQAKNTTKHVLFKRDFMCYNKATKNPRKVKNHENQKANHLLCKTVRR